MNKEELVRAIGELFFEKIQLGEYPTNGEVIRALFPKAEVYMQQWKKYKSIVVWFDNAQISHDFNWDWWNAPYKEEVSEKE